MKHFLPAKEMYTEHNPRKKMFGLLDEYFDNNEPKINEEENRYEVELTNELSKILNGYSLDEIKSGSLSKEDFHNTTLGNMYLYMNQNNVDDDFYYNVNHMYGESSISLLLYPSKQH
jgi:hypothetical protein